MVAINGIPEQSPMTNGKSVGNLKGASKMIGFIERRVNYKLNNSSIYCIYNAQHKYDNSLSNINMNHN